MSAQGRSLVQSGEVRVAARKEFSGRHGARLDAAHEALAELRKDTGRDVGQGAKDVYKDAYGLRWYRFISSHP